MYDAHQNLLFHIQGRTHQASVGAATAGQIFSERLHAVEGKRSAWNFKRVVNRRGYLRVAAASHEFEGGVAVAADETILAHVDQPMLLVAMPPSFTLAAQRPDRLLSRTAPAAGIQL